MTKRLLPVLILLLGACGDSGGTDLADPDVSEPTEDAAAATDDAGTQPDEDAGPGPEDVAEPEPDLVEADDVTEAEDDAGPPPEEPTPVTEPGPFTVGHRTMQVTYDPATFDPGRTLEVMLWYPTEDTDGTDANYLGFTPRPGVFEDASVAGDGPLPTLIFSHGNSGIESQSWFFTERLASHGWLVAAMRHTGNSLLDFDESMMPTMFLLRPLDLLATLDAVEALPEDDPLAGRVGEHVAAAGHSFGGYTTLMVGGARIDVEGIDAACAVDTSGACDGWTEDRRQLALAGFGDPRFDALIPMAPWRVGGVLPAGGTDTVTAPTLLMTAALDETTPDAIDGDPIWAGFTEPGHLRINMTTAGHFTYSHACDTGFVDGDGCGPGFLPWAEAFDLINAYSVAWLRRHVLDDESGAAILDGEDVLSPTFILTPSGGD